MSENPVEKSDIIKGDPIGEIKSQLDSALTSLTKFDEGLAAIAKTLDGSFKKAQSDTLKGINEINKAERESEKLLQEKIRTEQTLIKLDAEQSKLRKVEEQEKQQAFKTQVAIVKETERLAKVKEKEAKATAKSRKEVINSLNPYKRLTKQVNTAQDRFKRLSVQYGASSKQAKRAEKNFLRLDNQLRKVNTAAKDGRRDVGRYGLATEKMGKSLGKVTRLLGQFGLAMGGAAIVRGSFNVIKDFQQAQADLASVLSINIDQMKALTEQSKELGSTTRFTASQVAGLQTEFAKLGFTQEQILDMTPATLALAEATGTELSEAASVAGGTMNALGLESKDTQRIVDVMAKSFSSSALDMEKFKETMKNAAPIARATGVSLEVATAAAGKLADANISGSKAGTDLKKIFSELVKDGKPFEESLSDIAKRMDAASTKAEKLAIAEKIVGDRAKGALLVLTEQKDGLSELAIELENSEGAAAKMADTQRNTLGGAIDLLKSAWEGLILSMDEAGGIGEKLRKGIIFLSKNLGTILKVLGKVILAFTVYKTVMSGIKLKEKIIEQIAYNKSLKQSVGSAKGATAGVKAFGAAIKGLAIAGAVFTIIELGLALYDAASGAKLFREQLEAFNKFQKELDKDLDKQIKGRKAELKALLDVIDANEKLTDSQKLRAKGRETQKATQAITKQIEALRWRNDVLLLGMKNMNAMEKANGRLTVKQEGSRKEQRRMIEANQNQIRTLKGVREELQDTSKAYDDEKKDIIENDKARKKLNTTLKAQNELFSRQLELLQELDQIGFSDQLRDVQDEIDEVLANTAKLARETAELDVTLIEELVAKKFDILEAAALDRQEFEIATIIETSRIESEVELQKLKDKRDKLLAQEGLSASQRTDINKQYQDQLEQLEMDELQRAADLELQILIIKGHTSEEIIDIKKAEQDELNQVNDELIDAQIEGAEKLAENDKKIAKEKTDDDRLKNIIALEKAITQALADEIDKRIALKDKEIEAKQSAVDYLKQLAADGNIEAKQSIKAEIDLQREAQRQRDELERKKANLLLVSQAIQVFTKEVEGGAKPLDALATTGFTTTALTGILSGLINFFAEGTMNAPEGMAVVDEQGAEIITDKKGKIKSFGTDTGARTTYLNSGDIVHTAPQTSKIMDQFNTADNKIARLGGVTNAKVDEQISLLRAIKNKPEIDIKLGEVTQAAMEIVETRTKGGLKTVNTFKVKAQ